MKNVLYSEITHLFCPKIFSGALSSVLSEYRYEKSRVSIDQIPLSSRCFIHLAAECTSISVSAHLNNVSIVAFVILMITSAPVGSLFQSCRTYIARHITQLDPYQEGLTMFQRVHNVALLTIYIAATTVTLCITLPPISTYLLAAEYMTASVVGVVAQLVLNFAIQTIFYDCVDVLTGIGRATDKHVCIDGSEYIAIIPYYHPEADFTPNLPRTVIPEKLSFLESVRRLITMSGKNVNRIIVTPPGSSNNDDVMFDYDNNKHALIVYADKLNVYCSSKINELENKQIVLSENCLSNDQRTELFNGLVDQPAENINIPFFIFEAVFDKKLKNCDSYIQFFMRCNQHEIGSMNDKRLVHSLRTLECLYNPEGQIKTNEDILNFGYYIMCLIELELRFQNIKASEPSMELPFLTFLPRAVEYELSIFNALYFTYKGKFATYNEHYNENYLSPILEDKLDRISNALNLNRVNSMEKQIYTHLNHELPLNIKKRLVLTLMVEAFTCQNE
ncbi:hypothetical protein N9N03_01920 [Chlamydiia bacterium]|nr:hypothetical protein [Chlamydiia bacterium]